MSDTDKTIRGVELVPPSSKWSRQFAACRQELFTILGHHCLEIHHIGSTAIPGIQAKPIIDILAMVKKIAPIDDLNARFEASGYVCMGEYGLSGRRFYWKSQSIRTHHIHLYQQNDPNILRHLAFRDFLRQHQNYAQAYSVLKRCLADVFPDDLEHYIAGKQSFIQRIDYETGNAQTSQLQAHDEVIIQPYDLIWPKLAEAEINAIKIMTDHLAHDVIEHIGSTAVPNLAAKPVIDIFIMLATIAKASEWIKPLTSLGYVYWDENPDKTHLRFFKGMPPFGESRTHHVHIVESGGNALEHRILFRDLLRHDKKSRMAYETLKRQLSQANALDRELYTVQKRAFIETTLRRHGYTKPIH